MPSARQAEAAREAPSARHASGHRLVAGAAFPPARPYDADVLILALDRTAETLAAIASTLDQRGVSLHVVVLDQGSRPEALAALAQAIAGRDDATLLAAAGNLGVADGRNRAAGFGHGRVIVGLDNDAVFDTRHTLAGAVAALDADPGLAAIGLRILVDGTGDDDLLSWGYPRQLLPRAGDCFDAVTFVGAGHAIRRAAWQQAGGYDAALFFCWEEFDLCLRAIQRGWRIRYRGDLCVRHKVAPERRVEWGGLRWFCFVRNRVYIARKWGIGWPALTPRIAGYLLKGLRNGLLGQTMLALAAAARMQLAAAPARLSPATRAYLARHDAAYRGTLLARLRGEVLGLLPGRIAGRATGGPQGRQ
jgi:GT2 family glycosyltransferase